MFCCAESITWRWPFDLNCCQLEEVSLDSYNFKKNDKLIQFWTQMISSDGKYFNSDVIFTHQKCALRFWIHLKLLFSLIFIVHKFYRSQYSQLIASRSDFVFIHCYFLHLAEIWLRAYYLHKSADLTWRTKNRKIIVNELCYHNVSLRQCKAIHHKNIPIKCLTLY